MVSKICYNIYQRLTMTNGLCSCGEEYVGETKRHLEVRIAEHSDVKQKSEPARHLHKNPGYTFHWKILFKARNTFKRNIVEGRRSNPP